MRHQNPLAAWANAYTMVFYAWVLAWRSAGNRSSDPM